MPDVAFVELPPKKSIVVVQQPQAEPSPSTYCSCLTTVHFHHLGILCVQHLDQRLLGNISIVLARFWRYILRPPPTTITLGAILSTQDLARVRGGMECGEDSFRRMLRMVRMEGSKAQGSGGSALSEWP